MCRKRRWWTVLRLIHRWFQRSGSCCRMLERRRLSDLGYNAGWHLDSCLCFIGDITGDGGIVGPGENHIFVGRNDGNGTFAPVQAAIDGLYYSTSRHISLARQVEPAQGAILPSFQSRRSPCNLFWDVPRHQSSCKFSWNFLCRWLIWLQNRT